MCCVQVREKTIVTKWASYLLLDGQPVLHMCIKPLQAGCPGVIVSGQIASRKVTTFLSIGQKAASVGAWLCPYSERRGFLQTNLSAISD